MNPTRSRSAASLAALVTGLAVISFSPVPAAPDAPQSRTFRLVYEAVIRDVPETAERAFLWLPYPPDTEYQVIRELTITSDLPHEVVTEAKHGNRVLRFSVPPGTRGAAAVVEFEVTRIEHLHRPGGRPAKGRSAVPATAEGGKTQGTAIWLKPDRRVPIDDTIRRWANETVAGRITGLDRARAIYDYVVDNLRYDKSGTGWGNGDIYWACDSKRGNCTDFHAVFIGYARAVGIPARFEIGFPLPEDRGQGEIAGYHCWAEFYVEGEGWIPVDASEANKRPGLRDYFFGAHDENRVLFTVGRDLVLPGMEDEPLNFFVYPHAEVDGKAFAGVERRFSYRDMSSAVAHVSAR